MPYLSKKDKLTVSFEKLKFFSFEMQTRIDFLKCSNLVTSIGRGVYGPMSDMLEILANMSSS
jgi:hypothetical protein